MTIQSRTPGYTIVPPASASKAKLYRVVAPGLRLIGKTESRNMAELLAALDNALTARSEGVAS